MDLLTELKALVSDESRVTDDGGVVRRHGQGMAYHAPHPPDVVVFPESREEVAEVLRFASERGVPVVPFGEGSSLEGQIIPVRGGISLDLSRMDRIVEIRPEDFVAKVQPGVRLGRLNAALKEHGLFFPPDPGWDATLGGMAGTNASGSNALRYGVMRNHVLGLEVALADGTLIRTGGMAMKSSAGYDLTKLFVGSEGTLGVFTELTLRLYPIPEYATAARAVFPSIEVAGRAAIKMIHSGMQIGRVELVDARTIEAVNAYKGTSYAEAPTLFLDFTGDKVGVERNVELARTISGSEGCSAFDSESDEEARELLWEARHHATLAIRASAPDKKTMATDVCVPISELPEALREARGIIESYGLEGVILGHVGDGNYHAVFVVDPADQADVERAKEVNAQIVRYALERGGTCTGEHGVGSGKVKHLQEEHGDALPFMLGIKRLADPSNILNPGKIFATRLDKTVGSETLQDRGVRRS
jgi:D-lactate dehydrogenase (cytochrome)